MSTNRRSDSIEQLQSALRERGIDPSTVDPRVSDQGRLRLTAGNRNLTGATASVLADSAADEINGEGSGMSESVARATLENTDIRVSRGDLDRDDLAAFAEAGIDSDRIYSVGQDGRVNLTLYESEAREQLAEGVPSIEIQTGNESPPWTDFLRSVRTLGADSINPEAIGRSKELIQEAEDRRARRENREAARAAAETAGVDLDEFGIDARADGTVVVQDRDANTTRTIDPDASGGVGSAIDAATRDGQFVADDADPAASDSGSGDGLGARAAGAIVLLFGAIAAALGWLS